MGVIIKPVVGKVFIRLEKFSDQTRSGIKIVRQGKQWQDDTVLAEIMSVHPKETDVEAGQVVIIRGDAGRWIDPELVQDNEYTYRIIDKEEIIAIVNKEAEFQLGAV